MTVREACEQHWEAHKSDCNKFVKAVASALGVPLPEDLDADGIVAHIRASADYAKLNGGADAKSRAEAGKFVIAGLMAADHDPPRAHGHVVVVVDGDLDPTHKKYPHAYWGSLNGVGKKDETLNFAWVKADRDNVEYHARDF